MNGRECTKSFLLWNKVHSDVQMPWTFDGYCEMHYCFKTVMLLTAALGAVVYSVICANPQFLVKNGTIRSFDGVSNTSRGKTKLQGWRLGFGFNGENAGLLLSHEPFFPLLNCCQMSQLESHALCSSIDAHCNAFNLMCLNGLVLSPASAHLTVFSSSVSQKKHGIRKWKEQKSSIKQRKVFSFVTLCFFTCKTGCAHPHWYFPFKATG